MIYQVWTNTQGEIIAVLSDTVDHDNPIYAITRCPKYVHLNTTDDPAKFLDGTAHDMRTDCDVMREVSA